LPDSNIPSANSVQEEAIGLFERRFGVGREILDRITFLTLRDEIWACTSTPPAGITSERSPGLRALRRQGDRLKPTSTFLIALGDRITSARINLEPEALRHLLLGQRLPVSSTEHGYVALCFQGDVVGCGRIHNGILQALIPTGRRRELLGALTARP